MYRYRVEYLKREDAHVVLLEEHDRIVEMIEKCNHEEAEKIVCAHIDNQMLAVADTIRMQN